MAGKDSNYVPGWDCHGLPIEWKIEEELSRQGQATRTKSPIIEFRRQCRAFAEHWLGVQREEFKRLGVVGDWDHPYSTMSFPAEAQIAREIMKFAANGLLYRGSKPVMWSVVEKTALAEAEVEYEDHISDTVCVAFPIVTSAAQCLSVSAGTSRSSAEAKAYLSLERGERSSSGRRRPGRSLRNRAIAFSSKIAYGLYRVTDAPEDNWAKVGATYSSRRQARRERAAKPRRSRLTRESHRVHAQELVRLTAPIRSRAIARL